MPQSTPLERAFMNKDRRKKASFFITAYIEYCGKGGNNFVKVYSKETCIHSCGIFHNIIPDV